MSDHSLYCMWDLAPTIAEFQQFLQTGDDLMDVGEEEETEALLVVIPPKPTIPFTPVVPSIPMLGE
jgi:hypothetical protein